MGEFYDKLSDPQRDLIGRIAVLDWHHANVSSPMLKSGGVDYKKFTEAQSESMAKRLVENPGMLSTFEIILSRQDSRSYQAYLDAKNAQGVAVKSTGRSL